MSAHGEIEGTLFAGELAEILEADPVASPDELLDATDEMAREHRRMSDRIGAVKRREQAVALREAAIADMQADHEALTKMTDDLRVGVETHLKMQQRIRDLESQVANFAGERR